MLTALLENFFSLIIFNKFSQKVLKKISLAYLKAESKSISKKFKQCGSGFLVESPFVLIGPQYISVGENCFIHSQSRLEAWSAFRGESFNPQISIGNRVIINYSCHIGAINKIIIGNDVLIASRVFITDHFHGNTEFYETPTTPANRGLVSKGPVIIEDSVWIGEGVCIMPGVKVGKNSIIGANSVVTKDVPENVVAAGVPAKVIKVIK